MPDTQLVEDVGVVDGYVGQHDVGAVKLEEHVLADVASLHYLAGGERAIESRRHPVLDAAGLEGK